MRFRKLRIAFSATCLVVCVLLIALWVRSYWWHEGIIGPVASKGVALGSAEGVLTIRAIDLKTQHGGPKEWEQWHDSAALVRIVWEEKGINPPQFEFGASFGLLVVSFPHWFLVLITLTLATLPWIRQLRLRFSLRTLLIATTLVAFVLGLIVWLSR